jgi:serine/tyrosine/threonine adenylyltransferase
MHNDPGWKFDNSYARLPAKFFARVNPVPVEAPAMAIFNRELAESLGLNAAALSSDAAVFAGNSLAKGSEPIAQAYAGHQFGRFTMLGDGRAILLGEHVTPSGRRFDVQLKGSGETPYSRRGDGRAALGPMLREFIISEAMAHLGIPSTRSLAVVTTGEKIYRETLLPGAILTRVASSHIRVGTFEYAAGIVRDRELVRALADYTIARHFPELTGAEEPYLMLLHAVMKKQAALVSRWMHIGFIHGVMNTDNMAVSGESIDYGPCAFMDRYSPSAVFSSIDQGGRYAFGNQPEIAHWNLTRFAESLLPLLSQDQDQAVAKAEEALAGFPELFEHSWMEGMRAKLGLKDGSRNLDLELIAQFLRMMEAHEADYTNTFRALSQTIPSGEKMFQTEEFEAWRKNWQARLPDRELMRATNPAVIARNHRVEEALSAATERGDYSPVEKLCDVLRLPFEETERNAEYRKPPAPGGEPYQTFCGT